MTTINPLWTAPTLFQGSKAVWRFIVGSRWYGADLRPSTDSIPPGTEYDPARFGGPDNGHPHGLILPYPPPLPPGSGGLHQQAPILDHSTHSLSLKDFTLEILRGHLPFF